MTRSAAQLERVLSRVQRATFFVHQAMTSALSHNNAEHSMAAARRFKNSVTAAQKALAALQALYRENSEFVVSKRHRPTWQGEPDDTSTPSDDE